MKVGDKVKINTAPARFAQFQGLIGFLKANDEAKPFCSVVVTVGGARWTIDIPRTGLALVP